MSRQVLTAGFEKNQQAFLSVNGFAAWSSALPQWEPMKKTKNSSLRFACIAEERLMKGLQCEGEMYLLTPQNWKHVLTHGKVDFLLVESVWRAGTGDWYMSQHPAATGYAELVSVIECARKHSIPTVFWNTKDHEYHEYYCEFSKLFDTVYCADPRECELLAADGIQSEFLPPCVQPGIYSPYIGNRQEVGLIPHLPLYDCYSDLSGIGTNRAFFRKLHESHNTRFIASGRLPSRQEFEALPDFVKAGFCAISFEDRARLLKYTSAYITADNTQNTHTASQWLSVEALACRLPVLHLGEVKEPQGIGRHVTQCRSEHELFAELLRIKHDELYRERVCHPGWRDITMRHTFSNRLSEICKKLAIRHDWNEHPRVSLASVVETRKTLDYAVATYMKQSYPDKELILISRGLPFGHEEAARAQSAGISMLYAPAEVPRDECENAAFMTAQGECLISMQGHDYGPDYALDMVLASRAFDADLWCKIPEFYFRCGRVVRKKLRSLYAEPTGVILATRGKTQLDIAGRPDALRNMIQGNDKSEDAPMLIVDAMNVCVCSDGADNKVALPHAGTEEHII